MLFEQGAKVSIIRLPGNTLNDSKSVVMKDTLDMSQYVRKEQLCKYFYDVREWSDDPDTIIDRAKKHLGSTADKLPFKNPQHFAMWCKTGTYQLHC